MMVGWDSARAFTLTLPVLLSSAVGCAHGDDEWQRTQNDSIKLRTELDVANKLHAVDEQRYANQQRQIQDLVNKTNKILADFKSDPIGQLVGLGFSEEQIANLLLHRDKDTPAQSSVPEQPRQAPSDWKLLSSGELASEAPCVVTISISPRGPDPSAMFRTPPTMFLAFMKHEYSSKKACPKETSRYTIQNVRVDCQQRTLEILSGYHVDWNAKRTDESYPGDGTTAFTVYPDRSIGDQEWRYVCNPP